MIKIQFPVSFIKTSSILAASVFITFIAINLLLASDDQEMPDTIILDQDMCGENRRGPVEFSHLSHAEDYELSCKDCHHDYVDGENVWEEGDWVNKCSECHDPCESDGDIKKLKVAFHKNCIVCHRKIKSEWGSTDAPYRDCRDCHTL
ncbi:MAG: cytochrome c3 family protein [Deltaproteobacteria bacterium]|nr:cytochrome c3 family protein [Deltaproteobacteria bacterium]